MGLFDFFKKKEEAPRYDVTNLKVTDLDEGFIFDYDMKSWQVKEVYQYDWGKNNFSYEYKIDSGDEVLFLSLEDQGELILSLSKSIKVRVLGESIPEEIVKNQKPPDRLVYENETYYLDSDSAGYFNDMTAGNDDWEELISWEYFNKEGDKIISIVQWDERNFEASSGIMIKDFQISNIIPGQ
ncbi:MAG: DUF4178 domain-containing protein [Bacteroidota bacterium]